MFENGKMTLNKEQMKEVEIGRLKGLDVSKYENPLFNNIQMREIRLGLEEGLDVSKYANPNFTPLQMKEIIEGLKKGLDISKYADKNFNWYQMEQIRLGLESGIDITKYADKKFDADQMEEIRVRLEYKKIKLELEKDIEEIDVTVEKTLCYSIKYRVPKSLKRKELDNYIDELVSNEDFEYLKPIDSKITIK